MVLYVLHGKKPIEDHYVNDIDPSLRSPQESFGQDDKYIKQKDQQSNTRSTVGL